jgi:hypothetical protein
MPSGTNARRGATLLVALLTMVVLGSLVVGMILASRAQYRVGRNALVEERAQAAAEYGLNKALSEWDRSRVPKLRVGDTITKVYTAVGGASVRVVMTRLNQLTFWAVSEGQAGSGPQLQTRRRIGAVLRLTNATLNAPSAVLTRNPSTKISGSSIVSGNDVAPPGWDCPPAETSVPAGQIDALGNVPGGCPPAQCTGSTAVAVTAAAADTGSYFTFGNSTWTSLAGAADKQVPSNPPTLAPATSGSDCLTGVASNWGDPARATPANPCETYFPVLYAPGDLTVNQGVGQGMLLVNGDLKISGSFTFYGVVVVRNAVQVSGTGLHVTGALLVANSTGESNALLGNSTVQYSRCAVQAALGASTYPRYAKARAWADMF